MLEITNFDEYQSFTRTTAVYHQDTRFAYLILGLVSEAGEVADIYKKVLRDDEASLSTASVSKMVLELGDILWYIARIADELDCSLDELVKANVAKLTSRKERKVLKGSGDYR